VKWQFLIFIFLLHFISGAFGEISVDVYLRDCNALLQFEPNLPHFYPDIMIGTKLEIYVSSDIAMNWSGSLALVDANMDAGILSARDFNITSGDWKGSRFPAAGKEAVVWNWEESPAIYGFELHTGSTQIGTGRWFVIDYVPTKVDICRIGFYDHDVNWYTPLYYLTLSQVRSRDFNNDTKVDFSDFARLSQHWLESNCNEPNFCQGTDLDIDHDVDGNDLSLFIDFWLRGVQ
jgi:hypothetical protein